jgi:uncharacterized metal-binding protein
MTVVPFKPVLLLAAFIFNSSETAFANDIVALENCDENSLEMPLIVGFPASCDVQCAKNAMHKANIDAGAYTHLTGINQVLLYQVSSSELLSLRRETGDVSFIECDGGVEAQEAIGEKEGGYRALAVELGNCDENDLTFPLIITFPESCNAQCAQNVMKKASIGEDAYTHYTAVNTITLNKASSSELTTLRNDVDSVASIECDGIVSVNKGNESGIEPKFIWSVAFSIPLFSIGLQMLF